EMAAAAADAHASRQDNLRRPDRRTAAGAAAGDRSAREHRHRRRIARGARLFIPRRRRTPLAQAPSPYLAPARASWTFWIAEGTADVSRRRPVRLACDAPCASAALRRVEPRTSTGQTDVSRCPSFSFFVRR